MKEELKQLIEKYNIKIDELKKLLESENDNPDKHPTVRLSAQFCTYRNVVCVLQNILDKNIGSYSVQDMGIAWSEGYHKKVDEMNGVYGKKFNEWIENY